MTKNKNKILCENILKLLIRFSIPTISVLLINALYNMIDAIFVGNQSDGTLGIAGLTIVLPIQLLILALAQTIGMGSASILSRCVGAGEDDKAIKAVGNSFSTVIILGISITILGLIFIKPLLLAFGSTDSIYPYAYGYLRIILFGSLFHTFAVSTNCILRGEGNALIAMFAMVLGNIINIPLDYLFVVNLNMGVEGAAVATVISQIVCFVFLLCYFSMGKSNIKIKLKDLILDLKLVKDIISVGSPTIINHASAALLSIILINSLKYYGEDMHITILGIYNRTVPFVYFPMLGIMQALQPIIGFNYGANKIYRVKKALNLSLVISIFTGLAGLLIFTLFTRDIIEIFSNDVQLIAGAIKPYRIVILMIPVLSFQIIGTGFFQAIGRVGPALFLSMSRQIIFMIPLIILLPIFFKLNGIWYAVPLSDLMSGIVTFIFITKEINIINKSVSTEVIA